MIHGDIGITTFGLIPCDKRAQVVGYVMKIGEKLDAAAKYRAAVVLITVRRILLVDPVRTGRGQDLVHLDHGSASARDVFDLRIGLQQMHFDVEAAVTVNE